MENRRLSYQQILGLCATGTVFVASGFDGQIVWRFLKNTSGARNCGLQSMFSRWNRLLLPVFLVAVLAGCSQNVADRAGSKTSTTNSKPVETAEPTKPVPEPAGSNGEQNIALEAPSSDGMNRLSQEEIADGWIRLFDGQTLFGWKSNTNLNWSVHDGVVTADSDRSEDKCLLVTTTRFADYELRCDFKVAPGGNSGIFLRTAFSPKDPAVDCYELNMCDTHPDFGTGSLVKRVKPTKTVSGDGGWHSFHVRLDGPKVTAKFDGDSVLDYTDATEKPLVTGYIGLQMNGGHIEFRNVFLKPLGMKPLFDSQTLNGWHDVPGSKSKFEVKDGTIHVLNGRGFLETDAVAANFVFQFESKSNGDNLNSGVFFRAMKGTQQAPSNGYEYQLHNGFKDGNRNEPLDRGTGAIFNRVSARRVVSNDHEWTANTLVADGPHLSTWVNGIQVVDWTDDRPDDENPRNGRRTTAGHFSLQGHDPTTDIQFRNLRMVETPQ